MSDDDDTVATTLEGTIDVDEVALDKSDDAGLLVLTVAKLVGPRELAGAPLHFPNPFWQVAALQ